MERHIQIKKKSRRRVSEKTRQSNIVKYLKAVPGCIAEIRTQTGYGIKGGADILGCINGRHFELEVKQPKEKLTPLQAKWLEDWKQCGSISGRVEDVESTRQVFRDHGVEI